MRDVYIGLIAALTTVYTVQCTCFEEKLILISYSTLQYTTWHHRIIYYYLLLNDNVAENENEVDRCCRRNDVNRFIFTQIIQTTYYYILCIVHCCILTCAMLSCLTFLLSVLSISLIVVIVCTYSVSNRLESKNDLYNCVLGKTLNGRRQTNSA